MRLTLPADAQSAVAEVGGIAALLDKNGWKAAALIAVSVKPGEGHGGDRRKQGAHLRLAPKTFARDLKAKGWSENVIRRHFAAWEAAAEAGLVPHAADLVYGEKIDLPTENWQTWYPPRWSGDENAEAVAERARQDGVGASKAVDISQNTPAMAAAIKADPRVAEAATKALVETGDVARLSHATAAASKNRQVERNRERVSEGLGRGRSVSDPKPSTSFGGPEVSAFLYMKALPDALTSLVTHAPLEWSRLSDEARTPDIIAVWEEMCDKLDIAVSNIRAMIAGGISDEDLASLLEGGV